MTEAKNIQIDTPATTNGLNNQPPSPEDQACDAASKPAENLATDVHQQLVEAQELANQNYDRMLRTAAELENYKKRAARELEDVRKFANEMVFKDLLGVLDNLRRALDAAKSRESTLEGLGEGVALILAQLEKIFDKFNVKPIASVGEPFDPRFHQAMLQEPTDQHPANVVIKELQQGFTIHDRLLRPAMVVVSSPVGD